jgi:glutaredoxin 3
MSDVTIYGNEYCSFCEAARRLLENRGIRFEEITISHDAERFAEMSARSGNANWINSSPASPRTENLYKSGMKNG